MGLAGARRAAPSGGAAAGAAALLVVTILVAGFCAPCASGAVPPPERIVEWEVDGQGIDAEGESELNSDMLLLQVGLALQPRPPAAAAAAAPVIAPALAPHAAESAATATTGGSHHGEGRLGTTGPWPPRARRPAASLADAREERGVAADGGVLAEGEGTAPRGDGVPRAAVAEAGARAPARPAAKAHEPGAAGGNSDDGRGLGLDWLPSLALRTRDALGGFANRVYEGFYGSVENGKSTSMVRAGPGGFALVILAIVCWFFIMIECCRGGIHWGAPEDFSAHAPVKPPRDGHSTQHHQFTAQGPSATTVASTQGPTPPRRGAQADIDAVMRRASERQKRSRNQNACC